MEKIKHQIQRYLNVLDNAWIASDHATHSDSEAIYDHIKECSVVLSFILKLLKIFCFKCDMPYNEIKLQMSNLSFIASSTT